jgi:pSer/pThr/pTyr-binding forkhead associated (FHA) protein
MLCEITESDLKIDFNINVRLHRNKILNAIEDLKKKLSIQHIGILEEQKSQVEEAKDIVSAIEGTTMKLAVPLIRLICIEGKFKGNGWIITETCNTLGKASSPNVVTLVDGFLSSKHCQLFTREGKIYIKDLGSTNGTYIMIKDPTELKIDSLFKMGDNQFKVVSVGDTATLQCIDGVLEGNLFEVKKESEFTIGRKAGNSLSIAEDESLSSFHGEVFFKDNKLYVKDKNSTNKYYILYT